MFRYLFVSLFVYAQGGVADRLPQPPPQHQAFVAPREAAVRPTGGEKVQMPLLSGVSLLLPKSEIPTDRPDLPTVEVRPDFAYSDIVVSTSRKYGVDWRLVAALISAESNFHAKIRSPKGARGLMQVMPRTAAFYHVDPKELFDPAKNLEAGVQLLKRLQNRYPGRVDLALAAYNTGEAAVDRHKGIPPYRVTRAFVNKVIRQYGVNRDKDERLQRMAGNTQVLDVKLENHGSADSPNDSLR